MVLGHLIIYLLLFAGVFTFNIINTSYVPFLVDIVFLALSVILLTTGLILRASVTLKVMNPEERPIRSEQFILRVQVINRSIIPLTSICIKIKLRYNGKEKTIKKKYYTACPGRDDSYLDVKISCPNCETISYEIKKAYVYDALHLFVFPKRFACKDEIIIVPKLPPVEIMNKLVRELTDGDDDLYATNKPGDDPTEIFGIREYAPGDHIRNIHWKLSSKYGDLMVKEFSLPLRDKDCVVIAPFDVPDPKHALTDEMYDLLYGLLCAMTMRGFGFTACYMHQEYVSQRIETQRDIENFLVALYQAEKFPKAKDSVADLYFATHSHEPNRAFYITNVLNAQAKTDMSLLSQLGPVYYLIPKELDDPRLPVLFVE